MPSWSVSHLADHVLLHDARTLAAQDRCNTAALLVHLAEIESRRLYAAAGYPTMRDWCMGELHVSRDAAYRRIRAAGAARRFPAILAAIADGRLHLTAVGLLGPYLTRENLEDLVAAATHKDREEIELFLAHRFPRPDVPTELRPISPPVAVAPPATAPEPMTDSGAPSAKEAGELLAALTVNGASGKVAPAPLAPPAATEVVPVLPPSATYIRLAPLSPGRFALRGTLDQKAHDLLREAQALLGHTIPSGELMQVLERVLEEWVGAYRRCRQAATDKPRARRSAGNGRYVPAEVQRAVRRRDGDRCTFVSERGRRCGARTKLEFDHIQPVARGGRTTTENLRLRCRAPNQLEAERMFGAAFMRRRREGARERAASVHGTARAGETAPAALDSP